MYNKFVDDPHRNEHELSIIIPAKNESDSIIPVLAKMRHFFPLAEIIVVDNASTDNTAELAKTVHGVRVVHGKSPGKGHAMRCGALASTRNVLMFHDADSEYSVADAHSVAEALLDTPMEYRRYMMAIGVRAWRLNWLPVVSFGVNNLIRTIFWLRFKSAPEDVLTGTRCLTREAFMLMDKQSPAFAIETEITLIALKAKMSVTALPVRYTPRKHSEGKKINWKHLPSLLRASVSRRESCEHLRPCEESLNLAKQGGVHV